jgi:hypothetical protein
MRQTPKIERVEPKWIEDCSANGWYKTMGTSDMSVPLTDRVSPTRNIDRKDIDDPMFSNPKTEKEDANRNLPKTDSDDPTRAKVRRDKDAPN